jgi:hypothetical protein
VSLKHGHTEDRLVWKVGEALVSFLPAKHLVFISPHTQTCDSQVNAYHPGIFYNAELLCKESGATFLQQQQKKN